MPRERDILRFFRKPHFSTGEIARVRTLLRPNGTTMILPYDQFIEHDCRHLEAESDAGNPDYIVKLGLDAGFNAVAVHYGVAKRYWSKVEGAIPLIVKINGKTSVPSDAIAFSPHTSFIEDAIRLGAVGIGYTLYYGSPAQDRDLPQLAEVRRKCDEFGMPLVIWAYPRGEAIEAKGGKESSYALESAARLAMEMGATIIKSNLPKAAKPEFLTNEKIPKYYRNLEVELQKLPKAEQAAERARRVVAATQGVPLLFSGGDDASWEDMMMKAEACVKGGCFGFIVGRNMWKRKPDEAHNLASALAKFLDQE